MIDTIIFINYERKENYFNIVCNSEIILFFDNSLFSENIFNGFSVSVHQFQLHQVKLSKCTTKLQR